MLADPSAVLAALGLPWASGVEVEPLSATTERWIVCTPEGIRADFVVRVYQDPERATNHAAVVEALARAGFEQMPRTLALAGNIAIEEPVPGISALGLSPPRDSLEAAMSALASVHGTAIHEGVNWDTSPGALMPAAPPSLHRLGFAAHERERAAPGFAAARDAMLASPWGFRHGDATAANVLLAPGRAWLTSFHASGFGPQLYDVAGFLLTAGVDAPTRSSLARRYAQLRSLQPDATAELVDLAGILWSIGELLTLPRRTIELMGDDLSLHALNVAAGRIERGVREGAGTHHAATAIRDALWPS